MKLGSRQILFFLAAVAPVGKLILLPPQLAAVAGNDLLFPILAQLLVQAALVFCVLLLSRRERTVYALLEDSIGGVGAKIVTWALALFLLYASFMPLVEQKLLVQSIFYDTIPSYIVFAPFFLPARAAPLFRWGGGVPGGFPAVEKAVHKGKCSSLPVLFILIVLVTGREILNIFHAA